MKITGVRGREIFDSRGFPTIECELILEDSIIVTASVPAGASKGLYEAFELRDNQMRLYGKGVTHAIEYLEKHIAKLLIDQEPNVVQMDIRMIELDGTINKERFGANTMLAASTAILKAQALSEELELYELIAHLHGSQTVTLPFPLFNVINGGAHANNGLRIQEYMIMPIKGQNFREAMEFAVTVFHDLKALLLAKGKVVAVGDEGGFAPHFENEFEPLDYLVEVVNALGGSDSCRIALDIAASQFYDIKTKQYNWNGTTFSSGGLIELYTQLVEKYPIYSIEDGLAEDDWDGWIALNRILGQKIQIVGDDIFVTSPHRLAHGIKAQAANAAIIKPNQIGTVTQTLQAIQLCQESGMGTIISHRSGETEDTFIADLAVGTSAGQIKAGGCCRSERLAKYNRLLRIEDQLISAFLES